MIFGTVLLYPPDVTGVWSGFGEDMNSAGTADPEGMTGAGITPNLWVLCERSGTEPTDLFILCLQIGLGIELDMPPDLRIIMLS